MSLAARKYVLIGCKRGAPRISFTLIELLVVISIIAILAGLLTPALQGARDSARAMQCTSNLHQFSVAVHTYGSDFGVFPYRIDGSGNSYWKVLGPFVQVTNVTTGTFPGNLTRIFECPAQKTKGTNDYSCYTGYAVNPRIMRNGGVTNTRVTFPFLDRPAEVVLMADTCQDDSVAAGWATLSFTYVIEGVGSDYNPATANAAFVAQGPDADTLAGVRFRHKEKANGLFCDGHVEKIDKNSVSERHFKTLPNQ